MSKSGEESVPVSKMASLKTFDCMHYMPQFSVPGEVVWRLVSRVFCLILLYFGIVM